MLFIYEYVYVRIYMSIYAHTTALSIASPAAGPLKPAMAMELSVSLLSGRALDAERSISRGRQARPQYTMIVVIRTLEKGTKFWKQATIGFVTAE